MNNTVTRWCYNPQWREQVGESRVLGHSVYSWASEQTQLVFRKHEEALSTGVVMVAEFQALSDRAQGPVPCSGQGNSYTQGETLGRIPTQGLRHMEWAGGGRVYYQTRGQSRGQDSRRGLMISNV